MKKAHVIILGAAGFGGGELLRLLAEHPAVANLQAVSQSNAGNLITAAHPHLHNLAQLRFEKTVRWPVSAETGQVVVFSAMPNGELAKRYQQLNAELAALGTRQPALLIDLSGDFRLDSAADYQTAYGREHTCAQVLGSFAYGLPELNRTTLATATRIANPGCFATAINLALLPFAGLNDLGLVAVSAITGSSGSGVLPGATAHHPTRAHDLRAYKMLVHQHVSEVNLLLKNTATTGYNLSFVPHSAPLVRGIFATVQLLLPEYTSVAEIEQRIHSCYNGSTCVRVVDRSPRVATTVGTNFVELGYAFKGRLAVAMCALDNLGKGMASQAIQNMNIALGLAEATGLERMAVYP